MVQRAKQDRAQNKVINNVFPASPCNISLFVFLVHFFMIGTGSHLITSTFVWLKFWMCCTFAYRECNPLTTCFTDSTLMSWTHFVPCVSPSTSKNPLHVTGMRKSPLFPPHGGLQFGHLVEPNTLTSCDLSGNCSAKQATAAGIDAQGALSRRLSVRKSGTTIR